MRGVAVLALAVTALAACGLGSAQSTSGTTALKVTYWPNGVGTQPRATWTLLCNPARGTLPSRRVACRRLAADGLRHFAPVSPKMACIQIYGGPDVARVVGVVGGKRVWATFSRTDGCQIDRWNRLAPWLLPRGGTT